MIEQLFGSKTRVKLLQLFYSNPNRSFYVREITRKIGEQINSVRRELSNLLSIGIITSDTTNNKLYYEVNQKYQYFKPLKEIFGGGVKPTSASAPSEAEEDTDSLKTIGHVDLAVFTGQFTRDDIAGVDFLVVGDINPNALAKYVQELEEQENKTLRYTSMTLANYRYRQQIRDRFAQAIERAKKQILIDTYNLLSEEEKPTEAKEKETKEKEGDK